MLRYTITLHSIKLICALHKISITTMDGSSNHDNVPSRPKRTLDCGSGGGGGDDGNSESKTRIRVDGDTKGDSAIEQAMAQFFTCPICKDAIVQPMRVCADCPHVVCLICFESLRARSLDMPKMFATMHYEINFNHITCPCCTAKGPTFYTKKLTMPDAPLLGVLENVRNIKIDTKCPHCDYDAHSYLSILTTHLHCCPQRPIICTLCGNGFRVDCSNTGTKPVSKIMQKVGAAVRAHLEKDCNGIECKHCWNRGYMSDIMQCTAIHNAGSILYLQAKNLQNQINLFKTTRRAPVCINEDSLKLLDKVISRVQHISGTLGDQHPRHFIEPDTNEDGSDHVSDHDSDHGSNHGNSNHIYDIDI